MDIEWRLIGKQVIAWNAPPLPDHIARMVEPSLITPDELEKAFCWADVFVLPSYYEGLPDYSGGNACRRSAYRNRCRRRH